MGSEGIRSVDPDVHCRYVHVGCVSTSPWMESRPQYGYLLSCLYGSPKGHLDKQGRAPTVCLQVVTVTTLGILSSPVHTCHPVAGPTDVLGVSDSASSIGSSISSGVSGGVNSMMALFGAKGGGRSGPSVSVLCRLSLRNPCFPRVLTDAYSRWMRRLFSECAHACSLALHK